MARRRGVTGVVRAGARGLASAILVVVPAALPAQDPEERAPVVWGLGFEGNRAISDELLRASIATTHSSLVQRTPLLRWAGLGERRFFDATEFRRDVLRLGLLYRQSGFIEAAIDTIVRRGDGGVYIRFLIHEGRPIRVVSLDVTGVDGILDRARLLHDLPLQQGDPFNRLLLQASADTITAALADRGHPFAEVFRNFDEDRDGRVARVTFDVHPGPFVTVDSIVVRGTDRVGADVVRRAMAIRPGEPYRARQLRRSQLDLYRMDLFNYVNVGMADSLPPGRRDSTVRIAVQVTEAPLHRVRLGGGFGTIDCFRAQHAWTVHNFMGGGRTLQLSTGLSQVGVGRPFGAGFERTICRALEQEDSTRLKLNYNARVSLREPFVLAGRTSATLSLFAERHSEFQAFLREAVGGDLVFARQVGDGLQVSLGYGLTFGETIAEPAVFCTFLNVCSPEDVGRFTEERVRSMVSFALRRDRANSVLDPTRGDRLALDARHASRLIGSDSLSQFNKAILEHTAYRRTGRRSVLAWRVRVGTIVSPQLGLTGQAVRFVPPEERFYAGGPNTVRGFGQNELGPVVRVLDTVFVEQRIENGDTVAVPDSVIRASPTGGNDLIVANVEWRFPLPGFSERVSAALFVDAGQVFNREERLLSVDRLRVTPGAGVRVASPLGPVRLDVGFNPYAPESSRLFRRSTLETLREDYRPRRSFLGRFRVHVSVGQAF